MVQMARKASMGRTNARDAGQAAAAAGGGGGERPDLTLFTTKSPSSFFSRVNQVEGERGRRAGWARSESRRVAVRAAHLRRPCSALSCSALAPE